MATVVCGPIPTSEFASRISLAEDLRSRMSSAMLVRNRHSNSANGAFGRMTDKKATEEARYRRLRFHPKSIRKTREWSGAETAVQNG
jgi:hypothetical protein